MGLLKVQKIIPNIIATDGKKSYIGIIMCKRDENPAIYLVQVLEDDTIQKDLTFVLCEECFKEMIKSCHMHQMSMN